jgi:hypothetical protein
MRNMEEEFKSLSIMERIEFVRSGEKLNHKEFGASIGYSLSGYMRLKQKGFKLKQYKNEVPAYKMVALAIEAVYEVDHRWILAGEE